jgi:FAD/FMN-containing dehydrogenase/Fe-S oxidoreductase
LQGDVRFDRLSRAIYATDASIYEIVPAGVVMPRSVNDVIATVNECRRLGVCVTARGAGTGLTGGALGAGVSIDLSRFMNRIGAVDVGGRTIQVEPGVVLDELNAALKPHGLHFGPDVATSSRATLGGMIANNSCGAYSIHYGRTVDHVESLDVVLGDGNPVRFGGPSGQPDPEPWGTAKGRAKPMEQELERIRDAFFPDIQARFPKVLRSNGGYGLDRLGPPGTPIDANRILCGSEGTLGIVVGARLKLVPLPAFRGLAVLSFDDLLDGLGRVPAILAHQPAAIELIDRLIVSAARENLATRRGGEFLSGDPAAVMVVEFFAEKEATLRDRIRGLVADRGATGARPAEPVLDPTRQNEVWDVRKKGLGLLMSRPGDAQPYAFVEDSAVDPARLRDYIDRFQAVLQAEGVQAGYYAHASVGCLHVKPVLNLTKAADVERMRRIAESVSDLALEFGGAMTGEHGDGLVRSCWLEKMYGRRILEAFRQLKRLFDPHALLNPHKIVDARPMTEHLRQGPTFSPRSVKTHLDFSVHGGMAGLAGMCTGVGQCRQRLVGTMCPSFMATGDEQHTTRARANALRLALSNRGWLDGLDDPALGDVMDLCLSCKACKSECPTGVDMARLKAEFLAQRNLVRGVSRRSRWIADFPERLAWVSHWPRTLNAIMRSRPARAWIERRYGLDRRMAPPPLAHRTFRHWFRRHQRRQGKGPADRESVVYFVDTWTNYFAPDVGRAAVTVLERAGFRVVCPEVVCCGRPAISGGLLSEAKSRADFNIGLLASAAGGGTAIVGTEPSCILTLVDEYPQLIRTPEARIVAERAVMLESFLHRQWEDFPRALCFRRPVAPLQYHAHCHQKALVGSADAVGLLRRVWGDRASEIPSGCCGMAGSFGHEVEHYEIARAIGEDRLFPAVRNRGEARTAVSGFSCRTQIEHHTGVRPGHVIQFVEEHLA